MTAVVLSSQIFLIDSLWDKLIVYCADGKLSMYSMNVLETHTSGEYSSNSTNDKYFYGGFYFLICTTRVVFFIAGNVVVDIECIQMIDISTLHIHPACVISVTLTALKSDPRHSEQIRNNSFILNVSGRLFLVNQQDEISEVGTIL